MANNEHGVKRRYLSSSGGYSRFLLLKYFFLHGDGEYRFTLPQEMGLTGLETEMATEAWVQGQRERYKSKLHPLYLPLYTKLLVYMDATEAGRWWAPYSGFRDPEEQLKLYQKGRTPESKARGEKIVTDSVPGNSAHNYGAATDWAEWHPDLTGDDVWNKANWGFFKQAVRTCNMDWGGDWDRDGLTEPNEWDFPHCQLPLKCPWRKVGDIYRAQGMPFALDFINEQALTGAQGERV